jgi:hypothetical protein
VTLEVNDLSLTDLPESVELGESLFEVSGNLNNSEELDEVLEGELVILPNIEPVCGKADFSLLSGLLSDTVMLGNIFVDVFDTSEGKTLMEGLALVSTRIISVKKRKDKNK